MKKSLNFKIIVTIFFVGIVVAVVSCVVSYSVYKKTLINQSETSIQKSALSISHNIDSNKVEVVKDRVLEIYRNYFNENQTDVLKLHGEELENYLALYSEVEEMDEYKELMTQMEQITRDNGYNAVCIIYNDVETDKSIYIVDGTLNENNKCTPGVCDEWEKVEKDRIGKGDFSFPANTTDTRDYGWICSVGQQINNSDGTMVGTVCIDISMDEIMQKISGVMRHMILLLCTIVVGFTTIDIFIMRKLVVVPIKKLSVAASSFVSDTKGSSDEESSISRLCIKTGDEIEELSDSFKKMEKDLDSYISELTYATAERERVGAELKVATHIQKSMLPCIFPKFSDIEWFNIYATMEPAKEVGGDFYDFFMVDDTHIAIVMADVSGKGIPAALFMVIGKTLIKDHTKPDRDLGEIFTEVNKLLCESNSEELFITAFEGVLDIVTGEFNFVNAGHELPYICKKGGSYKPYKVKRALVLAAMEDIKYTSGSIILDPGDKIFQYTDGVTEATDVDYKLYGMERLENVLNRNVEKKPVELLPAIKEDIDRFVGEAPQFDDITMLCLEYKKRMVREG